MNGVVYGKIVTKRRCIGSSGMIYIVRWLSDGRINFFLRFNYIGYGGIYKRYPFFEKA